MDVPQHEYDKKFAEMQFYIPFLESMIQRLKSVSDKPRAPQLDKIISLYNIVTNPKKKYVMIVTRPPLPLLYCFYGLFTD